VSVLADHRADPGDDVPAAPSVRADADPEATSIDPALDGATRIEPASDLDPGPAELARGPLRPDQLRADFGAHFEANYQRLVAQLYAITLNPAEAHDVVREAYSRAWRRWAEVGSSADPTGWVRRVAVRSTMRSWRRTVARLAPGRRRGALVDGGEPRTRVALIALGRLADAERRAIVLVDMAGVPSSRSRRWSRCRRAPSLPAVRARRVVATPWPTSCRPPRSRSAPTDTVAAW
jgi:RNA polymerase sigma-70 factor (ECF subfamily)